MKRLALAVLAASLLGGGAAFAEPRHGGADRDGGHPNWGAHNAPGGADVHRNFQGNGGAYRGNPNFQGGNHEFHGAPGGANTWRANPGYQGGNNAWRGNPGYQGGNNAWRGNPGYQGGNNTWRGNQDGHEAWRNPGNRNGANTWRSPGYHGGDNDRRYDHDGARFNGGYDHDRNDWRGDGDGRGDWHGGDRWRGPHSNWGYHGWAFGAYIPRSFLIPSFFIDDYAYWDLSPPPPDCEWVQDGPNALLVDVYTGEVLEVVPNYFY